MLKNLPPHNQTPNRRLNPHVHDANVLLPNAIHSRHLWSLPINQHYCGRLHISLRQSPLHQNPPIHEKKVGLEVSDCLTYGIAVVFNILSIVLGTDGCGGVYEVD